MFAARNQKTFIMLVNFWCLDKDLVRFVCAVLPTGIPEKINFHAVKMRSHDVFMSLIPGVRSDKAQSEVMDDG